MSRRRGSAERAAGLILDPGVLEAAPVLEVFGWQGVAAVGGTAVLPWRPDWLQARQQGIAAVADPDDLGSAEQPLSRQAVVHQQKGRDATRWGLAAAWRWLADDGRLLLCGDNLLGIKSAIRQVARELEQQPRTMANRAHGRVVSFRRSGASVLFTSEPALIAVTASGDRFQLRSAPGLFSAGELDPGTLLLLDHLQHLPAAEGMTVFDPGCGTGVLGLAALRRFPGSTAVLADADWRAVRCSRANAADLGLDRRCRVRWWDAASEPAPLDRCHLALVNPPFHRGKAVDLNPARAMFRALDQVLARGGTALIVANRTLPYERDLRPLGRLAEIAAHRGYKLLSLRR